MPLNAHSIATREALEIARETLFEQASQHDTASPEGHRLRQALETIEAILAQRGLEGGAEFTRNDCGPDGYLTNLMDTVIFG